MSLINDLDQFELPSRNKMVLLLGGAPPADGGRAFTESELEELLLILTDNTRTTRCIYRMIRSRGYEIVYSAVRDYRSELHIRAKEC